MAPRIAFLFARLFHRDRLDREMEDEIALHIVQRAEELKRQGIAAPDAMRRARLEFGGQEKYKEQCRETRRFHLLHDFVADLRFAIRLLRKSPGFTTVVLLTLTLGIGANTAMFTLLDALVLRDLPVPHPEQLVHFGVASSSDYTALSLPMFEEISRRQTVFSSTFAWWGDAVMSVDWWGDAAMNVEADSSLTRADVYAVSGNYYSELGGQPELGRLIGPQDFAMDHDPVMVAVLGYGLWKRAYAGDAGVIGRSIKINGVPFTVIGVTSRTFTGTSAEFAPEISIPITAEPLINGDPDWQKHLRRRTALWLEGAGRLKPGVTVEQARAQLEGMWPSVRNDMIIPPDPGAETAALQEGRFVVESLAKGDSLVRERFRLPVLVLLGISGLVLLLACTNLAGLMLARSTARQHELGIRMSLGASHSRIVRQILAENLLLAAVGTVAGFILALWASSAISKFVLATIYVVPASLRIGPDFRLFLFGTVLALFTGVFCGLAPAWNAIHKDPNHALQTDSRTTGRGTTLLGKNLVVAQICISLVLLVGAGLLIRSLEKLHLVQPGFRTTNVLSFELFPKPNGYKNVPWISYYRDLTQRVLRLPGVESAGLVHSRIGNLMEWTEKVREHESSLTAQDADCEMAMPGFFSTLRIGLVRGRDFAWQDDERSTRVAIVSEKFAKRFFPSGDAIGKHVDITSETKWQDLEIVGIVRDASLYDIRKPAPPTIYLPSTQYGEYMGWSWLLVRTSLPPASLTESVRAAVGSQGHEYIPFVTTVSQDVDRSILQERMTALFSALLGGLAVLLAAIGVYGLLGYNVTRRTREIGIRISLGAQRDELRRMILRETLSLWLLGITTGIPVAFGASRYLQHMLFGVSAHDPATIAAAIAALGLAAFLAAILPAWRAMRVDPIVALRCE